MKLSDLPEKRNEDCTKVSKGVPHTAHWWDRGFAWCLGLEGPDQHEPAPQTATR